MTFRRLAVALVALTIPACNYMGSSGPHTGDLSFVMDYHLGLQQAQEHEKPVMLFFTADW